MKYVTTEGNTAGSKKKKKTTGQRWQEVINRVNSRVCVVVVVVSF